MDKTEFRENLIAVKSMIDHGARHEHRLHSFDFFSYFNEVAPEVFSDIPYGKIQSPEFKAYVWDKMAMLLGLIACSPQRPRKESDNVIDFYSAREKLRA